MKKSLLFGIIFVLVAGGIAYSWINYTPIEQVAVTTDYKNTSYEIEGVPLLLVDGVSELEMASGSASKITTRYFGNEVNGDFNNDSVEDVAFLLTQDRGGTGTFYYVVAALKTELGYTGTNGIFLGDRIAPQTTEYKNGEVIVNYADRKLGEAMTEKPTVGISKYLKIENEKLVEVLK